MRVIALGSPFNDDSIAWRCLQDIETSSNPTLLDMDINYCASPATELIHLLHRQTPTLLIDALLDETHASHVQQLSMDQLARSKTLSSHGFSVSQILQLADHLKCLPESLWIIGISISPTELFSEQQITAVKLQLLEHIQSITGNH